jgi:pre-mRNA-splicing factor 38B
MIPLQNNRAKNLLPFWGPDDSTFHFNPLLLQKVIRSQYFQKCCRDITDWNSLVDEIYYQVKHLEPWAVGTYATVVGGGVVVFLAFVGSI